MEFKSQPKSQGGRARSPARAARRFAGSERGNVAIIFAFALIPVVLAIGAGIDYGSGSAVKAKLDGVADAASLSAVSYSALSLNATTAQTNALAAFNAQVAHVPRMTSVAPTVTVTDGSTGRTAVVSYSAVVPTSFMGLLGKPTLTVTGQSTAASSAVYIDIYSLLDDSPSMGLAATTAGQNQLAGLTGGCAFGCHESGSSNDNYTIARNNNIQMRIDVLRTAWSNLITSAQQAPSTNHFRVGTYTFDTQLNELQALTSNLGSALTTAAGIDLLTVPSSGPGSTYTDNAISSITSLIPAAGDGSSLAQTKKFLILVTDGVQDFKQSWNGHSHYVSPMSTTDCNTLLSKGVQVAVIYTTYLPILPANDPDGDYPIFVQPIASQIQPDIQACASPGLFFTASDEASISAAFVSIFATVLGSARLTN